MTTSMSGFYCSTSGTMFATKEEFQEHMKSDFHRYNLKRKVRTAFYLFSRGILRRRHLLRHLLCSSDIVFAAGCRPAACYEGVV